MGHRRAPRRLEPAPGPLGTNVVDPCQHIQYPGPLLGRARAPRCQVWLRGVRPEVWRGPCRSIGKVGTCRRALAGSKSQLCGRCGAWRWISIPPPATRRIARIIDWDHPNWCFFWRFRRYRTFSRFSVPRWGWLAEYLHNLCTKRRGSAPLVPWCCLPPERAAVAREVVAPGLSGGWNERTPT